MIDHTASTNQAGTELIVKAVNTLAEQAIQAVIELENAGGEKDRMASVTTITSAELDTVNTFAEPNRIVDRESRLPLRGMRVTYEFPRHSVTVIRICISKPLASG